MRRYILYALSLVSLFALTAPISFGQNRYDALRFSQNIYEGTARSMAMGNAFTALGGDLGAVSVNPASTGVYRHNEFSITPSVTVAPTTANYLSAMTKTSTNSWGISNVGYVGNSSTGRSYGLVSFNFGIIANRTNNFAGSTLAYGTERNTSMLAAVASEMANSGIPCSDLNIPESNSYSPFWDSNAPWKAILAWNTGMLDTMTPNGSDYVGATENVFEDEESYYLMVGGPLKQRFNRITSGHIQDYTFNFGGNVSNKFFFGINLNIKNIWYSNIEQYSETSLDHLNFDTQFSSFEHRANTTMSGMGLNLKGGVIFLPVKGLRLGATISTPTWTSISMNYREHLEGAANGSKSYCTSPDNLFSYDITTPFNWGIGAAYTFGKIALISADLEGVNYSTTKFDISNDFSLSDIEYFEGENRTMRSDFRSALNWRTGIEVKPVSGLSLRAGYSYYDYTEQNFNDSKKFCSFGVGYTGKSGFFIDAAYVQQLNTNNLAYTLYNYDSGYEIPTLNESSKAWKLLLTVGLKF